MFTSNVSPIAVDFGASSVKLLQITNEAQPSIVAAAELPFTSVHQNSSDALRVCAKELPKLIRQAKFKGRRAVCAVPADQAHVQHMQLMSAEGVSADDQIKAQLHAQIGCTPDGIVVRAVEVANVHRDGQALIETICFALSRDTVMRHVELLKKCKLEVVGVHTAHVAMVKAFDHLTRRESDDQLTSLYVDLGWGGTRVAIAHGRKIAFARSIPIGGRHFDQHLAASLNCDLASAKTHRLSLQDASARVSDPMRQAGKTERVDGMAILNTAAARAAADEATRDEDAAVATERRGGALPPELAVSVPPGDGIRETANVDLTELLDTISDELSMCLRYHQGLFPGRALDRVIFVGGEARQMWLCQHIVKTLRLPAQLGDPLVRLKPESLKRPDLCFDQPQPGWAVACGLCNAPTDL